jgi:hypothetical protein
MPFKSLVKAKYGNVDFTKQIPQYWLHLKDHIKLEDK